MAFESRPDNDEAFSDWQWNQRRRGQSQKKNGEKKGKPKKAVQRNSEAAVAESMPNNSVEPEVDDVDEDDDNGSESSSGSEDGKQIVSFLLVLVLCSLESKSSVLTSAFEFEVPICFSDQSPMWPKFLYCIFVEK